MHVFVLKLANILVGTLQYESGRRVDLVITVVVMVCEAEFHAAKSLLGYRTGVPPIDRPFWPKQGEVALSPTIRILAGFLLLNSAIGRQVE